MRACVWGATEVEGDSGLLAVERGGGGMGIAGYLVCTHILPISLIFLILFLFRFNIFILFSYNNFYRFWV